MSYIRPKYQDVNLTTEDGDLLVVDGDFSVYESDQRHIEHILVSEKGGWREWPVLGVGLFRFLNGVGTKNELQKKCRLQIQYDNMKVQRLTVTDLGKIDIQAVRLK